MKKVLCIMMTVLMAMTLVSCIVITVPTQETPHPSADINPMPSAKIDPTPTPTPVSGEKTTQKPKTGVVSSDLKELIHTDYKTAKAEVQDKHVSIEADDSGKWVKLIVIDGDCSYTIDGVGYGIPYGHTTMRLAEKYGDAVWGDDSYAAFEIPGLQATIGIYTEDGTTASRVEIRSGIYY